MFLGLNNDHAVEIKSQDLTTHGVVLGRTGSGKTGLISVLVEEATCEANAGVIVFDVKGDLGALARRPTSDEEVASFGDVPDNYWSSLNEFGYGQAHAKHWRHAAPVTIYGGATARALSVVPSFSVPAEITHDRAADQVALALDLIYDGSKRRQDDVTAIAMTKVVLAHWEIGQPLPITAWPYVLTEGNFQNPFFERHFPRSKRTSFARVVLNFLHNNRSSIAGEQLNIAEIAGGRRVAVLSLHLMTEQERHAFVAAVLRQVTDFMRRAPGSDQLKLLLVLDEARGFLPPYPMNPPTKPLLAEILAKGRAQGIGVLLGTQNPMDIDYKCLSNVGTWFIGRLRERDCVRDLRTELSARNVDASQVLGLEPRRFLTIDRDGGSHVLRVRHALSILKGPIAAG